MLPQIRIARWCWLLTAFLAFCPDSAAQAPVGLLDDLDHGEPLLRREHWLAAMSNTDIPGTQPQSSTPRFRMFRMVPGFLNDPVGLDIGDDVYAPADDPAMASMKGKALDSLETPWLSLAMGQDNPWFDMRLPGDPGGVGYYRLHSQMQVADLGSTSICLGLQAVTPSGQQDGGLQNGPTIVAPGFSVFQDLGSGMAFQGYVSHRFKAALRDDMPENALNWGMGFQCPLPGIGSCADQGVFLFMQALACYNYDGYRYLSNGHATTWEFIPGIHYRINSNCWMSLGASKNGQLTCSWQF